MSGKSSCLEFQFRGKLEGERVVAFEDMRGREPYECLEVRSRTPRTRCPGWWMGVLMEERKSMRRPRTVGGASPASTVCVASCGAPSERLLAEWKPISAQLSALVDGPMYRIWLEQLHPHSRVNGVWTVGCDPRRRGWIVERFRLVLQSVGELELVVCEGPA